MKLYAVFQIVATLIATVMVLFYYFNMKYAEQGNIATIVVYLVLQINEHYLLSIESDG